MMGLRDLWARLWGEQPRIDYIPSLVIRGCTVGYSPVGGVRPMAIKLGNKVRDTISGFSGVAAGRAEYMYGCNQILISPDRTGENGAAIDSQWFDEQRVETVDFRPVAVSEESSATAGGPQRYAPKR